MRIVMVGPFGFHPKKTMRARAFPLARALVTAGHSVHMLMPAWHTPENANSDWTEAGVAIRYTSLDGGPVGTTLRLVRETLALSPDVVHCFKPKAYSGLVAAILWQFRRRSLRLIVDSDDWEGWGGWNDLAPYSWWQKRFFAWQERWGMRHCHALTVASRALESLAWAQPVPPDRVFYLPNGPGITAKSRDAKAKRTELAVGARPTVLLYSRLFEFDSRRLGEVLARVKGDLPDVAILVVGAGLYADDAAEWQREMEAAGVLPSVIDVGWTAESALPDVLSAADVGLYLMDDTLLNRTKCPVKLADMLALGIPVVAERVGQVPEYVLHGETGFVHEVADTKSIAADLIRLLRDETLRQTLSNAAQEHIRANFSWDRLGRRLARIYGA